jgi:uncharacterized membrane protein YphA (DoxX/SURF4 family)
MKILRLLSRVIAGMVFVFSGFVKALDPMGSAIKFTEYFQAFHFDFLAFTSIPLAVAMSAVEFMIGLNLLAGLRMKFTTWMLLLLMSFFTMLTLILALFNPVSDCGCFGDALKLTNWETFGKNIVLMIPSIYLFIHRNTFTPMVKPTMEWSMVAFNFLFSCGISSGCLRHQPILDFRPYKVGTWIPEKMVIPENAPTDQYQTLLIYEKDGRKQEFTEKDFPWQDTTWKWKETRQKLLRKGYEPPIHDFSITSPDGIDITSQLLSDSGYVFLIIATDLEKASEKGFQKINRLALKSRELGFTVHGVTSSTNKQIAAFNEKYQPAYDLCSADETTLKTIIRANPGVLLLHQGTILGKWNHTDTPDAAKLNRNLLSIILLKDQRQADFLKVACIALLACLVLTLAYLFKQG